MQSKTYHYIECGLDNVWLENGFELSENGELFIAEIHQLHKVIGESLVQQKNLLNGKEIKYIRRHLDLSQSGLGGILGVDYQSVLNWEKDKHPINESADRLLKVYYYAFLNEDKYPDIRNLISQICEMDAEVEKGKILLRENDTGWARAA